MIYDTWHKSECYQRNYFFSKRGQYHFEQKNHISLIISDKWMIIFLFDYCGHLVYHTSKDKFFEYQFLQKYTLFASRLRTFRSALGLRVNDVEKICPSSMLRRMTW